MAADTRSPLLRPVLLFLAPLSLVLAGCGGPNLIERMSRPTWGFLGTIIIVADIIALIDLIGDEHRGTTGTVIWALLIVFMPVLGVILYFILGSD